MFFVDDGYRTPSEHVEGLSSPAIRRQLNDGTSYRLVKVPRRPADLQEQLRRIGWHIITSTAGPFYWEQATEADLQAVPVTHPIHLRRDVRPADPAQDLTWATI